MNRSEIELMIRNVEEDRVHGASWLSRAALDVLASASKTEAEDSSQLLAILTETSKRLIDARPSMAPLANIVAKLMQDIQADVALPLHEFRKAVVDKASILSDASERSLKAAAENASRLLDGLKTVMTISYSSSVLEALTLRPEIRVIVPESRPLYEGRRLAEDLVKLGAGVTYIVDAAMGCFVEKADAAMVGADSVLADGSVVNKIGTRLLALAARDVGIPFYVVCETLKFDSRSYLGRAPVLEEKDPSEVVVGLDGSDVRNPYFEVTPGRLITSIVTEEGRMKGREIEFKMQELSGILRPLLG